jgi:hypothetical protein
MQEVVEEAKWGTTLILKQDKWTKLRYRIQLNAGNCWRGTREGRWLQEFVDGNHMNAGNWEAQGGETLDIERKWGHEVVEIRWGGSHGNLDIESKRMEEVFGGHKVRRANLDVDTRWMQEVVEREDIYRFWIRLNAGSCWEAQRGEKLNFDKFWNRMNTGRKFRYRTQMNAASCGEAQGGVEFRYWKKWMFSRGAKFIQVEPKSSPCVTEKGRRGCGKQRLRSWEEGRTGKRWKTPCGRARSNRRLGSWVGPKKW